MGKYLEAEKLEIQVLDARNRILGVEHPDTIDAMANLAATYRDLEKYTEAGKLEMQVLNARKRILGVEHLDTIRAMENLAVTYYSLGKKHGSRGAGDASSGCQEKNSWNGTPRYN